MTKTNREIAVSTAANLETRYCFGMRVESHIADEITKLLDAKDAERREAVARAWEEAADHVVPRYYRDCVVGRAIENELRKRAAEIRKEK